MLGAIILAGQLLGTDVGVALGLKLGTLLDAILVLTPYYTNKGKKIGRKEEKGAKQLKMHVVNVKNACSERKKYTNAANNTN